VLSPDFGEVGLVRNLLLALAIVAEVRRLEDARAAELRHRLPQLRFVLHDAERRDGKARALQELLFAQTILRGVEDIATGPERHAGCERIEGLDRNVLKLVGDDIDALRELEKRGDIGERDVVFAVGDLAGRAVGRREEWELGSWRLGDSY
jgi:hypothetical protein